MRQWLPAIALSLAGLAGLAGLAAAQATQAAPPARVEIAYQVLHNGGPLAEVKHVLEHDGKTYRLSETWTGSGLLAMLGEVQRSSRGEVAESGLRPLEYEDRRPRRKTAHATFSWLDKTLTQKYRDGPQAHPLPPQAQDRLSFLFTTAFHAPGRGPLEYHVADGKGVSHYVLEIAGRERLSVPEGDVDALRLVKREDDGRSTQIWLDPGRHYLPLRVLVVQKDGSRIDQVATRITMAR